MSTAKTQQLQIRVSPAQKAALQAHAKAAGQDVSSFVLARALPEGNTRFRSLTEAMTAGDHRYALAELNDLLTACPRTAFADTVADAALMGLEPYLQNYVAALVEQAADRKGVHPPPWTATVAPLASPYFVTPLRSLRLHLLRAAPVPFKRRNIFVDSAIGARV
jgi:hypothetical protein